MTLDEIKALSPGAWVVYAPKHGPREDGNLVRITENMVFIAYRDGTKATRPEDLILPFAPTPMGERLWVDDERPIPEPGWYLATTSERAIHLLETMTVREMSLDFSLKGDDNGLKVMEWLRDHPDRWPETIHAHSSSSSGRWVIERCVEDWRPK